MHNRRPGGVVLLIGLVLLLTSAHVALASTSITDANGWTVTFVSRVYNSINNTTTFTYTVKGTSAQRALSNFVVALPTCSPNFLLLSYSPTRAVTLGLDPKSGVSGIKWDLGIETASSQTYSFTYRGNIPLGATQTSTKAGTSIALTALPGPACQWPRGKIVVKKVTVGGDEAFPFTPSYGAPFSLSNGQSNTSAPLAPGSYSVSETVPTGWDQTGALCDNGNPPGAISLEPGQTVTCTFTNTRRGTAKVVKTVTNATTTGAPSGAQSFTFDLRQGASASAAGSLIETQVANAANGGMVTFAPLIPGAYQLCERATTGWQTTLSGLNPFILPGTTDTLCGDFTVAAGETKTLTVDDADRGLPQCPGPEYRLIAPPAGVDAPLGIYLYWQRGSDSLWRFYIQQTMWDAESGIASITPVYPPTTTASSNITYNGLQPFTAVGSGVKVVVKGMMGGTEIVGQPAWLRVLVTDNAGNQSACDPEVTVEGP